MNRQTNMSDGNKRPEPEASSSASPVPPRDSDGRPSSPDERAQAPPTNQSNPGGDQLIAKLKQGLEKTRLPADLREQNPRATAACRGAGAPFSRNAGKGRHVF